MREGKALERSIEELHQAMAKAWGLKVAGTIGKKMTSKLLCGCSHRTQGQT